MRASVELADSVSASETCVQVEAKSLSSDLWIWMLVAGR